MFITGEATFKSFAVGTISVVAVAMFGSLTVLPAVLSWLGDRVEKGRIPFTRRLRRPAGESRVWSGDRRPRHAPAGALGRRSPAGLLIALAIPALGMNTIAVGPGRHPAGPADHADLRHGPGGVPGRRSTSARSSSRPTTSAAARSPAAIDELVAAGRPRRTRSSARPRSRTATTARSPRSASRAAATAPTTRRSRRSTEVRDDLVPATVGAVDGADGERHRRRRAAPRTSSRSLSERCRWCSRSCSAWRSC